MSAFNDPRYLAAQGLLNTPRTIEQDKPCPKCGYNLKGLTVGGVCPECGRAISVPQKRMLEDTLIDAPRAYLHRFAISLSVAFLGLAMSVLGIFTIVSSAVVKGVFGFYQLGGIGMNMIVPSIPDRLFAVVFLVGAAMWAGGLLVATLPRPTPVDAQDSRKREWMRLRVGVGVTQAAWFVAAVLAFLLVYLAPQQPAPGAGPSVSPSAWMGPVAGVALFFTLTGIVGLIPTAVLLARFADWVPDTDLGWRMRTSAWSIAVFGTLLVLTGVTPPGLPSFAGLIPFLLWISVGFVWAFFIIGLLVQFWSIGQLASAGWAAKENHRIREERDQRMLEKMRREKEEYDQRIDAVRRHVDEPAPGIRKVGVAPRGPDAHPTPRPKP